MFSIGLLKNDLFPLDQILNYMFSRGILVRFVFNLLKIYPIYSNNQKTPYLLPQTSFKCVVDMTATKLQNKKIQTVFNIIYLFFVHIYGSWRSRLPKP